MTKFHFSLSGQVRVRNQMRNWKLMANNNSIVKNIPCSLDCVVPFKSRVCVCVNKQVDSIDRTMLANDSLNDDCLRLVLEMLTLKEKVAVVRVCRRWKKLVESTLLKERCLVITTTFNQPFTFCPHLSCFSSFDPWQRISSPIKRATHDLTSTGQNTISAIPGPDHFRPLADTLETAQPTDHQVDVISCRPVREALLILSITQKLTMLQFNSLLNKLPRLASIAFHSQKNCELVSQHVLNSVMHKSLAAIDLSDCREVTTQCLAVIASRCSSLRYLNLSGCRKYGNRGLKDVLRSCPLLERLILCHNRRISGLFFSHFGGKRLTNVDLTSCSGFTNRGLHMLAQKSQHSLQTFVSYPISSVYTLNFVLSHFRHLRKLVLTLMAELDLTPITQHLPKLRSLSLLGIIPLNEAFFHKLTQNCVHMIEFELCLSIPKVSPSIPIWPALVKLRLSNILFQRNLLQLLASLEHLHSLQISSSDFRDEHMLSFLTEFRSYPRLETLDLDYFQKERATRLNVESIQKTLAGKGYAERFEVKVNRLKLNKMSLYLTKVVIRSRGKQSAALLF